MNKSSHRVAEANPRVPISNWKRAIHPKSLLRAGVSAGFPRLPKAAQNAVRSMACIAVRTMPEVRRTDAAESFNRWLRPVGEKAVVVARMRLGHKMLLDLRSLTEYPSYYTGDYSREHQECILAMIRPDWTILDVGANVGLWAVPMARALKTGQLHCFEPVPSNYERLTQNIRLNGLTSIARVYPFGLSDQEAHRTIALCGDFLNGSTTGNASFAWVEEDAQHEHAEIQLRVLDEILKLDRLDFIKLDIEGHEDFFLRGAARTISRFRPMILMEVNNYYYLQRGLGPTELFTRWMADNNYCCALQVSGAWTVRPLAERLLATEDVLLLPIEKAHAASIAS